MAVVDTRRERRDWCTVGRSPERVLSTGEQMVSGACRGGSGAGGGGALLHIEAYWYGCGGEVGLVVVVVVVWGGRAGWWWCVATHTGLLVVVWWGGRAGWW